MKLYTFYMTCEAALYIPFQALPLPAVISPLQSGTYLDLYVWRPSLAVLITQVAGEAVKELPSWAGPDVIIAATMSKLDSIVAAASAQATSSQPLHLC